MQPAGAIATAVLALGLLRLAWNNVGVWMDMTQDERDRLVAIQIREGCAPSGCFSPATGYRVLSPGLPRLWLW